MLDNIDALMGASVAGFFVFMAAVVVLGALLGGMSTQYLIEYWASNSQKKYVQVKVPLVLLCIGAGLLSFVVPHLIGLLILAAVITWLVSFFIPNPYYQPKDDESRPSSQ